MTSPTTPEKIEPLTEQDFSTGPLNGSFDLGDMDDAAKLIRRISAGEDCLTELTMLYANNRRQADLLATITDRDEKLAALRPPAAGEDVKAQIVDVILETEDCYGLCLGNDWSDHADRIAHAILSHLQSVGYTRVPEREWITQVIRDYTKNPNCMLQEQPAFQARSTISNHAPGLAFALLAALNERG